MGQPVNDNEEQDPPTFVCIDCDVDVYLIGWGPPYTLPWRCSTCQFISEVVDPIERERMREFFKDK